MFTTRCCLFFFFIVFLTHMHNQLVSLACTRYRSNADDSTLFNCCCRSMGLLNFSTRIRLINQMLLRFKYTDFFFFSHFSTGKCLSIIIANMFFRLCIWTVGIYDETQSTNQKDYQIVLSPRSSLYRNVRRARDKKHSDDNLTTVSTISTNAFFCARVRTQTCILFYTFLLSLPVQMMLLTKVFFVMASNYSWPIHIWVYTYVCVCEGHKTRWTHWMYLYLYKREYRAKRLNNSTNVCEVWHMIRSLGDMSIERVVLPCMRKKEKGRERKKIKQQQQEQEKFPFNEPNLNIRWRFNG